MSEQKVVIITGATRGIGLETARHLSQKGYRVFGSARKTSDTKDLDGACSSLPSLEKVILDVTDANSTQAAVDNVLKKTGRVDVLINNACDVAIGTVETCSLEQQVRSMDINYFGAVRMLQSVLPSMRKQKSGHIINISSISGFDPYPPIETYSATKFALEGLTESLVTTLSPWNIKLSLVEPGGVKTKAPELAYQGERVVDGGAFQKYSQSAQEKMIASYSQGALETSEIATLIWDILQSPEPHLRYQAGEFTQNIAKNRFKDPTGLFPVQEKRKLLEEMGLYQLLDQ